MFTHKQLFDLVSRNIRMETLMKNAMDLNAWEKDPGYANFEKSAEVCVQALKEAGFSNIEKIACKCDGVTAAMDHTMPQAWDRTGRCTLEIISGKMSKAKRLLCDSDRDPLEAGLWSPSTPEEGLTGEVVPGEENADVAGKYVYTPDPPKNKQMIAWSRGGATDISNCVMLCKTHNRSKGNR